MLSNSSIQNQNVINSNNISGSSSGSVLCNSLTLTDGTNTTTFGPTSTTINTLTVNGTSTFNGNETHNGVSGFNATSKFYASCQAIYPADFRLVDSTVSTNITQFYQVGSTGIITGNFNSSKLVMSTKRSTGAPFSGLTVENGNHAVIQGQSGQGIDILNDQIAMNGVTTFNNSVNVNNNTITLSDGTTTNTLNKSDWTGTIKTQNSTQNLTHYLNMSDSSATGQGNPQKSTLITANPSNGNITATSFNGAFFGTCSNASNIALTSDNTSGTYFIPFSKTVGAANVLYVDDVTGP